MELIVTLFRRSRATVALAVFMGIVSGAAGTFLVALFNAGAVTRELEIGTSFFVWVFGLIALIPVSHLLSLYLLERLGQQSVLELRLQFSRQVLTTPLRRIEELGTARILTVLTEDVRTISDTIILLPSLVVSSAIVLGCIGYMAWLSTLLFAVLVGLIGMGILGYQLPMLAGVRRLHLARRIQEDLIGDFRGLTEGVKELKINKLRRLDFMSLLTETAERLRKLRIVVSLVFGLASSIGNTMLFLVLAGLVIFQPSLEAAGGLEVASYMVVLVFMITPLQNLLNAAPQLARVNTALARIQELGLSLPERKEIEGPETGKSHFEYLRLEDVEMSYDVGEHSFHLGPVSLDVSRGEMVFLVGGNGSGKTTLMKILIGLYPPERGQIVLNGEPITESNVETHRCQFSVVFADFFLFNKLLGVKLEEVGSRASLYLEKLALENKVKVEDGRLSTTSLSQGQRKRLALFAAYLEDRPVFFFDEWAADQDPTFKEVFYYLLLPELRARGKTILAISHDDRYYEAADRIVKLENGRIIYDGPPADLLNSTGGPSDLGTKRRREKSPPTPEERAL